MRPGGGAHKGSSFERKMARELSKWWYGKPDYLWRRPGPGTSFWKRDKHRHSGDVVPSVDRIPPYPFPFHVELKCFSKKRLKLHYLLFPDKSPIKKMWFKVIKECRKDLVPMLLLKANNVPIICVMRSKDIVKVTDRKSPPNTQLYYDNWDTTSVTAFPWDTTKVKRND